MKSEMAAMQKIGTKFMVSIAMVCDLAVRTRYMRRRSRRFKRQKRN